MDMKNVTDAAGRNLDNVFKIKFGHQSTIDAAWKLCSNAVESENEKYFYPLFLMHMI